MASVTRYSGSFAVALLLGCQSPVATSLPISKRDETTQWWGNESFGSRQHYVHVVRDSRGQLKDVYRYYLDERGRPVLDGERTVYRWEHDAGHIIIYRDGHVVSESDVIITG